MKESIKDLLKITVSFLVLALIIATAWFVYHGPYTSVNLETGSIDAIDTSNISDIESRRKVYSSYVTKHHDGDKYYIKCFQYSTFLAKYTESKWDIDKSLYDQVVTGKPYCFYVNLYRESSDNGVVIKVYDYDPNQVIRY